MDLPGDYSLDAHLRSADASSDAHAFGENHASLLCLVALSFSGVNLEGHRRCAKSVARIGLNMVAKIDLNMVAKLVAKIGV